MLNKYKNIWEKFLKPINVLNCDVKGDRIQQVLWRALNLPVFSNLSNQKILLVFCGTNNLLLNSLEDIAAGILEIAACLLKL